MSEHVAVGVTTPVYNSEPPFHPGARYPELPFDEISLTPNEPYRLLRDLFLKLGLDRENYGGRCWNPLGMIVKPEQKVVIKPNFVMSYNASGDDLFGVVTHPSILRAAVDYVYIALKGRGRIIIADAPQMDCNWDELMAREYLSSLQEFYCSKYNFNIEIYDLRNFCVMDKAKMAYSTNRKPLPGDPEGSVVINIGRESEFYGLQFENYYGADYNRVETIKHHHGDIHEYSISKTILSADTFISIPKMKVHKKVGVTLNLKGLVGINTDKNYLIHYRVGTPKENGDQLPDQQPTLDRMIIKIQRYLFHKGLSKQTVVGDNIYKVARMLYKYGVEPFKALSVSTAVQDGGSWYGNDSAWRMTADLAKIILFADNGGKMRKTQQRKTLSIIDGIVGGENNGPLSPGAKRVGALVVGTNLLAVDMVGTRLMGFDYRKLKQFTILNCTKGYEFGVHDERDIVILSDDPEIANLYKNESRCFAFNPPFGWMGKMEI
jgi:uncharacterized protein (DUF362 family)